MPIHSASALLIHSCIDRLATDGDATVELTATIERLEQLHCSEVAGLQANLRKHLEELSGVRFRYEKERCSERCHGEDHWRHATIPLKLGVPTGHSEEDEEGKE
ncbi:conserved hypothetical protein [Histoplasma capsulatum var. duboisii H88]|uniref:Uncharacterized protein n=1 Tax=Ajellomyces capsulatus (strain H88) TaxID=544711 RepID=F0UAV0_AJEC8|nr:conserved hypothetical protein [Histoplasma capsulatum var. duboisii H88]